MVQKCVRSHTDTLVFIHPFWLAGAEQHVDSSLHEIWPTSSPCFALWTRWWSSFLWMNTMKNIQTNHHLHHHHRDETGTPPKQRATNVKDAAIQSARPIPVPHSWPEHNSLTEANHPAQVGQACVINLNGGN